MSLLILGAPFSVTLTTQNLIFGKLVSCANMFVDIFYQIDTVIFTVIFEKTVNTQSATSPVINV